MDDDVLVNNFHDDANVSCGLTKNEVIKLLYNQDNNIALVAPEKFKSPIWERFRVVYFKGEFIARSCSSRPAPNASFKVSDP